MYRSAPLDRFHDLADMTKGLAAHEVETRSARYGENLILESTPGGWLRLLQETAKDPMLWFLLGTSGIFALVSQWTESVFSPPSSRSLEWMPTSIDALTHPLRA